MSQYAYIREDNRIILRDCNNTVEAIKDLASHVRSVYELTSVNGELVSTLIYKKQVKTKPGPWLDPNNFDPNIGDYWEILFTDNTTYRSQEAVRYPSYPERWEIHFRTKALNLNKTLFGVRSLGNNPE